MGLFNAVGALIDVGKKSSDNYKVAFFVKEPNKLFGSVQTTVSGSGDTGLNLSVESPNVFGAGERIRLEQGFGTKTKSHFSFSAARPLQCSPLKSLSTSVFRRNFLFDASGLLNVDHGLSLDLHTQLAPYVRHRIGWEGSWRYVHSHDARSPYAMRQLTGHALKSAVINEIVNDTRDHPILPEEGYALRFNHELAGLGGDIFHSKQEASAQLNCPLLPGYSLQGTLAGGFIAASPSGTSKLAIADRFFLGGLHLRGFAPNHVGEHVKGFAMGGNMFWTSGLHMYAPLPFTDPYHPLLRHVRLHGFVNAGNVGLLGNVRNLFVEFPTSVGGGLVVGLGRLARLEINLSRVLRSSDFCVRTGTLSFGFGVNYS